MLAQIAQFAAAFPRLYIILSSLPYIAAAVLCRDLPLTVLIMLAWTLYRCRICPPACRQREDRMLRLGAREGITRYRRARHVSVHHTPANGRTGPGSD